MTTTATPAVSPREVARLQREPFATRIKPIHPETVAALKGWQKPQKAYILFETWEVAITQDADKRISHGLFTLDVEGRAEQIEKVRYYLRKGYRLLDWGNFPAVDSKDEKKAARAIMYGRAWDRLEKDLELESNHPNLKAEKKALQDENDELRKRLAEFEKLQAAKTQQKVHREG